MENNIDSNIKPARLDGLPEDLRVELKQARVARGWSQSELGRRTGLPQAHISGIETGKIVPRFDTLLDLVRVLDRDLLTVPRELVPAVQALLRDHRRTEDKTNEEGEERSLYELWGDGGGSYSLSGGNNAGFEINLDEIERASKPQENDGEEDDHHDEI
jgi:transcriptional regulator with XRE-family HTH domain